MGFDVGTVSRFVLALVVTAATLAVVTVGAIDADVAAADSTTAGPSARNGAAMATLGLGDRAILFGGQDASGPLGDTWEFTGATRTWRRIAPAGSPQPSPRWGAAMALFPGFGVLLFGGWGYDALGRLVNLSDTWVFDGEQWQLVYPAGEVPRGRHQAAMAYDNHWPRMVLFGGRGDSLLNDGGRLADTWTFNRFTWHPETASSSPPAPRYGHTMWSSPEVDFTLERSVWVYGGDGGDENVWIFDSQQWTSMSSSGLPRVADAAAWSGQFGRVLLGGRGGYDGQQPLREMWCQGCDLSADPFVWVRLDVRLPPARFRHSVAYLPGSDSAVLFGGTDGQRNFGDTWLWQDSKWKQIK